MDKSRHSSTCAGVPVSGAIHMLSKTLLESCRFFSGIANESGDNSEVIYANTACILCSTSSLEALLNEWISVSANFFDDESTFFWRNLEDLKKKLKINEKWNLIAAHYNSTTWANSQEPFQSFSIISSLRNEFVHYKGDFLGKEETPTKKIKSIMNKFGVKTTATFVGDDVSSWAIELLTVKSLGNWIYDNIKYFHDNIYQLLITKP